MITSCKNYKKYIVRDSAYIRHTLRPFPLLRLPTTPAIEPRHSVLSTRLSTAPPTTRHADGTSQRRQATARESSNTCTPSGTTETLNKSTHNHEKILYLNELDKKHTYFASKLYDLVEDSFYDHRGDFLDFLKTFKSKGAAQDASSSATTLPVTAQPTNVSFQSLPKIDLTKFSGKFSDWENFRDVFRSIIHRREDLSPYYEIALSSYLPYW